MNMVDVAYFDLRAHPPYVGQAAKHFGSDEDPRDRSGRRDHWIRDVRRCERREPEKYAAEEHRHVIQGEVEPSPPRLDPATQVLPGVHPVSIA